MFRKPRSFFIFAFSVLAVFLLSVVVSAQTSEADHLNQEGFNFLYHGFPTEALSRWRRAEALYRTENNVEGEIGTQLNQSLAEQALGLYPRACQTITQSLTLSAQLCQANIGRESLEQSLSRLELTDTNRLGIRLLGENLRLLGNLAEAEAALTFIQTQPSQDAIERERVALGLGNVESLRFRELSQVLGRLGLRDVKSRTEILARMNRQIESARAHYLIASHSRNPEIAIKAELNLINLLVNIRGDQPSEVEPRLFLRLSSDAQSAYASLMSKDKDFEQLAAIDCIYSRLNLARNLLAILRAKELPVGFEDSLNLSIVEQLVSDATVLAEQLDHKRALSFAYGIAAELKEQQSASVSEIAANYTQAFSLAQSVQASDISYRWAYELAKLEKSIGHEQQAAAYYESSLAALTQVREDLVAVNSELQFDFSEKVEPVYRDYLKFLVGKRNPDFKQALQIHQSFQLAQLENFLRCGRLISSAPRDQAPVTLHIINLEDEIEVLVERGDELHAYSASAAEILRAADNLSLNVHSPSFLKVPEADFLPYAQLLYDKLIRPAINDGLISNQEPLRFALDAPFKMIPMGLLHDGQQYLAVTHSVSRSLQLQSSGALNDSDKGLFVGLSEQAPSFSEPLISEPLAPLPGTNFEAEAMTGYLPSTVLLNADFTMAQLADEMSFNDYEIVHISTHGQFSSVPEQTFLTAWDELIDIPKMAELFHGVGNIDLLVLSACQTAAGDERSALGLAGLAVQSGAQNAIASLWLVDSLSSSVLMDRFYEDLSQGLSKADSLHDAQLFLMNSSAFNHPFYWAPFLLIVG